jgi:hypothetical protein
MFFCFCDLVFLYWKTDQKNLDFIRTFLAIILRTIVVEYVKESQGGFESTLDYFPQVNGLVYHLL